MTGIEHIGTWFPENRESVYDLRERFAIDDYFIEEKTGVQAVTRIIPGTSCADMCINAYADLRDRHAFDEQDIEVIIVVTQNPGDTIPHVSALVHGRLGLKKECACFDISLGCSGFVYGLSVISAFMQMNNCRKGLLFTADPYSGIIDETDKNTRLLFGDASTVTLLGNNPVWKTGAFSFGTIGQLSDNLTCSNGTLQMNGRGVFEFVAKQVPADVQLVLLKNNLRKEDVDVFLFHQGSKYIIDTLARRIGVAAEKMPFHAAAYGNTVSSSIPIMLQEYLDDNSARVLLLSGFGVGLSYASVVLTKI